MWKEVLELLWRIVEAQGLLRDVKRLWAREAKGELFFPFVNEHSRRANFS